MLEENAAAEISDLREKLANKGTSQQEIDIIYFLSKNVKK